MAKVQEAAGRIYGDCEKGKVLLQELVPRVPWPNQRHCDGAAWTWQKRTIAGTLTALLSHVLAMLAPYCCALGNW